MTKYQGLFTDRFITVEAENEESAVKLMIQNLRELLQKSDYDQKIADELGLIAWETE